MIAAAPFGFYGSGNIGDEATLQGFARLLALSDERWDILVASQDPAHTARVEPAFLYHQYQGALAGRRPQLMAHLARAYVFPGGTPIMDGLGDWPLSTLGPMVEHARRRDKPVAFVGIGTEPLSRPASRAILTDQIAGGAAHWSVRAQGDHDRLLELGVPADKITVAADMAWLLSPAALDHGRRVLAALPADGRPLIGVNVNAEEAVMKGAPGLLREIAGALDAVIEQRGARVIFLCNEVREEATFDLAAAREVQGLMARADQAVIAANDYLSPPQMMSIIGCCDLTISTRYHFCLFSALQGVPFVAIQRSGKVADLCADLSWEHGATPQAADAGGLAALAGELLDDREVRAALLTTRVQAMAVRARLNLRPLEVLREQAGGAAHGLDWLRLAAARALSRAA